MKKVFSILALWLAAAAASQAKVELPPVLSDNMVLQQKQDVAVWGWTDKGRTVTIRPSWTRAKYTAAPDSGGKWMTRIPTPAAGGPYSISFSDGDKTTIGNVLIGEVWFCSGQSNMEMPVRGFHGQPVEGSAEVILGAKPSVPIRMCTIGKQYSPTPLEGFELAGADRVFKPATARVRGGTVVVRSPQVPEPVAVRYCFRNWCRGSLFNSYGIPALPFRSDDWPLN